MTDDVVPPHRLIIIGAVEVAAALCRVARAMGWEASVVDPRDGAAVAAHYPGAEHVTSARPEQAFAELGPLDGDTSVVVVTHDADVDDPALALALRSEAAYVGAIGSRRTQAARAERLRAAGLTPAELARLAGPAGLDIGARSPEESALAIAAEIVALRRGRAGGRLTDASGSIRGASA